MYEANLAPISNRADWIGTIEIVDDDTNETINDLTGLKARLEVRSQDPSRHSLVGTTEDGHITLTPFGIIQWRFTTAEMLCLEPGTYQIGITITREDITEQELVGSLPIIDGVVRQ